MYKSENEEFWLNYNQRLDRDCNVRITAFSEWVIKSCISLVVNYTLDSVRDGYILSASDKLIRDIKKLKYDKDTEKSY